MSIWALSVHFLGYVQIDDSYKSNLNFRQFTEYPKGTCQILVSRPS